MHAYATDQFDQLWPVHTFLLNFVMSVQVHAEVLGRSKGRRVTAVNIPHQYVLSPSAVAAAHNGAVGK